MKNILLGLSQQVTHSNRQFCLLRVFSYVMMWGVSLHLDVLCVNVDNETTKHQYDLMKSLD